MNTLRWILQATLSSAVCAMAFPIGTAGASVVWHREQSDAVYTTTAISGPDTSLCAGTYLNPPQQVELVPLAGAGVADWVYAGRHVEVDASDNAEVIAAVDTLDSDSTVTVYKWHADSGTPDWSYVIHSCERAVYRSVAVSSDGSRIAVLVTMRAPTPFCRLYVFDVTTGVPITFDAAAGTYARNLAITAAGEFVAFRAGTYVYVVAGGTGTVRWSENFFFASDPISVSGDGDELAYGSTGLFVRQWNGTEYAFSWALFDPSFHLSTCTLSADGGTLAAGWHLPPYPFAQIKVVLFATPSSTPLWTYLYPSAGGTYQEYPADIAVSSNGGLIAVGSYGDAFNLNPEVHVFQWGSSSPVLTLDTPGSIFDVDLLALPGGGAYVAACGKHVHANALGRGGDLYSIEFMPTGVREELSSGVISAHPNPSVSGRTTVFKVALEERSSVRLGVYSATGELIATLLDEVLGPGDHTVEWDGRLASGRRAAAGVYVARVDTERGSFTRRITLLR